MTIPTRPSRDQFVGIHEDPFADNELVSTSTDVTEPNNNILYEISVAPEDQHYNVEAGARSTTVVDEWSDRFIQYLSGTSRYKFIVETAYPKYLRLTPGKYSRIHFHGVIKFTNIAFFLNEQAHHMQQYATIKISQYRPDKWPDYLKKQEYLMEPFLRQRYTLTNVVIDAQHPLKETVEHKSSTRKRTQTASSGTCEMLGPTHRRVIMDLLNK